MSHPDHAFNPQYRRTFDHLQPELAAQGIGMRETQNAAGVLALEAHRRGVVPERVALGDNADRVFAAQGEHRYAQIDLQAGMRTPLIDSSRQALTLLAAQPQPSTAQQSSPQQAVEPGQDQTSVARGR